MVREVGNWVEWEAKRVRRMQSGGQEVEDETRIRITVEELDTVTDDHVRRRLA